MRDAIALLAYLDDANVKGFIAAIRAGEGTADEDGFRRMFGGELFDSFADHPRRAITKKLGGRPITSTAAGVGQFLARTWDECAAAIGLRDFSPKNQLLAMVFLIERRRALDDVLAGRFEQAVRKCAREWASLPGSPYGQPTKTMAQALATYTAAGGTLASPAPETAPALDSAPLPGRFSPDTMAAILPQHQPEQAMPLPAILAAILPAVFSAVPELVKTYGSGSAMSERNAKGVAILTEVAKAAVGAKNEQELAEVIEADPQASETVRTAVKERWFEITEAGGGGIEGARKADVAFIASGAAPTRSPAFLISLLLILMPFMLLVDVLFVNPSNYDGPLRTQIVTAVLIIIGLIGAFWLGSSNGSQRKTELLGK